jgi:threonine/homoserine/homoserine lactone efflux protein
MILANIVKGILVATVAWLPLGPVVFLCMSRTLTSGIKSGIVSGIGASLSDAFYMTVIIFGLHSVAQAMNQHEVIIRLAGGVFMTCYAIYLWRMPLETDFVGHHTTTGKYITDAISTFFVAITNPIQLITIPLIFSALGAQYSTPTEASALYIAIVATLIIIAVVLPFLVMKFRTVLVGKALVYINKIVAGILFLAGIASLVHTIEKLVI